LSKEPKTEEERIQTALKYISIGLRQLSFVIATNKNARKAIAKITEAIELLGEE